MINQYLIAAKYGAIVVATVLLLTGGSCAKSKYDDRLIQKGYDVCKSEQSEAVNEAKDISDVVTEARDDVIYADKTEQRSQDTVTRAQFNDLKRDKENDRITFERLLRQAIDAKPKGDGRNCAVELMPDGLQRRADPEADNFGSRTSEGDHP